MLNTTPVNDASQDISAYAGLNYDSNSLYRKLFDKNKAWFTSTKKNPSLLNTHNQGLTRVAYQISIKKGVFGWMFLRFIETLCKLLSHFWIGFKWTDGSTLNIKKSCKTSYIPIVCFTLQTSCTDVFYIKSITTIIKNRKVNGKDISCFSFLNTASFMLQKSTTIIFKKRAKCHNQISETSFLTLMKMLIGSKTRVWCALFCL